MKDRAQTPKTRKRLKAHRTPSTKTNLASPNHCDVGVLTKTKTDAVREPKELPSAATADRRNPASSSIDAAWAYAVDCCQRQLLFIDTLRERAANMLEHERAGLPPLLKFKYEMLLDARRFDRPVNYALLQITEMGEHCYVDCANPDKPPVVVIDPRAGHGPGIGGFKRDSEIGIALSEGHPVYFVMFFPEPVRGQTLEHVHHALRRFVDVVAHRHPHKSPVLYGNCQAGWAATLLSADCEGLVGAVVLNGSPLSYWAGAPGVNPMRLAGGLLGGVWLVHLAADSGDGRFDGAWLAANFENLQPEKAIWEKYAKLFHNIDTERSRFLEFERWWNGYYFLSREEILGTVERLFIGNQLESGRFRICEGCEVDLRRIHNPIVIFSSYGDNITPPHQALGWIPVVYKDTKALKKAGQRIVYLTNPHVGHLGIFVSANVARLEHRAILEGLAEIAALEPGLYEMKIDNPTGDPDCRKPLYSVRFEPRDVEQLHFQRQSDAFDRVRSVSAFNESMYSVFASAAIQAATNPYIAEMLQSLHPMRTSRYFFADVFNPWMRSVAVAAKAVNKIRTPLRLGHPLLEEEQKVLQLASEIIASIRKMRDAHYELVFKMLYQW